MVYDSDFLFNLLRVRYLAAKKFCDHPFMEVVMQHQIYAVKDKAANAFLQPIFSQTEATVLRSLKMALADPQHTFSLSAKDYSLYYMGLFDDVTGTLVPLAEPVFVVSLDTVVSSMEVNRG